MSKRRNRKKQPNRPNLPSETLERARRQAAIDRGELPPEPAQPEAEAAAEPEPAPPEPAREPEPEPDTAEPAAVDNPYRIVSARERRARSGRRSDDGTVRRRRRTGGSGQSEKKDVLDGETVAYLLHNPTKIVSEDELRADYGYVMADLRSMGLLAAVLFVTLIALALLLV